MSDIITRKLTRFAVLYSIDAVIVDTPLDQYIPVCTSNQWSYIICNVLIP